MTMYNFIRVINIDIKKNTCGVLKTTNSIKM